MRFKAVNDEKEKSVINVIKRLHSHHKWVSIRGILDRGAQAISEVLLACVALRLSGSVGKA
jgi:hypothetical protein